MDATVIWVLTQTEIYPCSLCTVQGATAGFQCNKTRGETDLHLGVACLLKGLGSGKTLWLSFDVFEVLKENGALHHCAQVR